MIYNIVLLIFALIHFVLGILFAYDGNILQFCANLMLVLLLLAKIWIEFVGDGESMRWNANKIVNQSSVDCILYLLKDGNCMHPDMAERFLGRYRCVCDNEFVSDCVERIPHERLRGTPPPPDGE